MHLGDPRSTGSLLTRAVISSQGGDTVGGGWGPREQRSAWRPAPSSLVSLPGDVGPESLPMGSRGQTVPAREQGQAAEGSSTLGLGCNTEDRTVPTEPIPPAPPLGHSLGVRAKGSAHLCSETP